MTTATFHQEPRPRRALPVVVHVTGAPGGGHVYRLREGTCTVGSSSSCDLVIDDPTTSRCHVELALVPDGVSVRDLGSRNGTFYLGQRIEKMTVVHGACLTLGRVEVRIEPDAQELEDVAYEGSCYRGLLGTSRGMRRLFGTMRLLEGSGVTVHVTGESGVGKELVASALHEGSGRSGPLVTLNCGAISRELVASELFGHRRGAFTGAVEPRRGAFESAHGGTLFLDEVGELPLEVQPVLLRALETGEVRAVGSDRATVVDVRVVSATHRDLEKAVREGRFREDLYYRLAVIKLEVPPLRERPEDVEVLARRFAEAANVVLPPEAIATLRLHTWPGNVRELKNAIQAFAVLRRLPSQPRQRDPRTEETLAAFARHLDVGRSYGELKDELLDRFQQVYLELLLERTQGNQTAAAKLSGLDRTYLGRLLARHRPVRRGVGE